MQELINVVAHQLLPLVCVGVDVGILEYKDRAGRELLRKNIMYHSVCIFDFDKSVSNSLRRLYRYRYRGQEFCCAYKHFCSYA